MFRFTDREFLESWHLSIRPFTRDVDHAEYLAARQWESLAIAQYVYGPHGSAAR